MFQIEIPRRNPHCSSCQAAFDPGEEVYSALWNVEEEHQWVREDYCSVCWEKVMMLESFGSVKGHWKTKVPLKKESSILPKQRDERAFYLLKEALKSNSDEDQTEAFILALFLARKRLLVLRQEMRQENGETLLLYEYPLTEEILCIKKFPLSNLETEKIQLKLAAKFKPAYTHSHSNSL